MTLMPHARKRLRRYALFCLMAAGAAAHCLPGATSYAEDCFFGAGTHDTPLRCDWVDESGLAVTSDWDQECGWCDECPELLPLIDADFANSCEDPDAVESDCESVELATPDSQPSFANTCNFDTCPEPSLGEEVVDATPRPSSPNLTRCDGAYRDPAGRFRQTETGFNTTLATIVASVGAGNPVSFSHWTEPFAMVGPAKSHLPEQIEQFESWFQDSYADVQQRVERSLDDMISSRIFPRFVPFVDFDGIVEATRTSPPSGSQPSSLALVETTRGPSPTDLGLRKRLIGSSPVIVTLEEYYFAHVEETADEESTTVALERNTDSTPDSAWPVAAIESPLEPICIHSFDFTNETNWSPLAKNTATSKRQSSPNSPEPKKPERTQVTPTEILSGIVDRLLAGKQDLLNRKVRIDRVIEEQSRGYLTKSMTLIEPLSASAVTLAEEQAAGHLGIAVADCIGDASRWMDSIARDLGNQVAAMPAAAPVKKHARKNAPAGKKRRAKKPGAGEKLIARAQAAPRQRAEIENEVDSAESFSEDELARVIAQARQWVDVARDTYDQFQNRLHEVTEVARHRGAQDDSSRR